MSIDRIHLLKKLIKEAKLIEEWQRTGLQKGSDSTDANGNATVNFPTVYATTPFVFLQGVDAGAKGIVLDVVSKSTTQFVVKARKVTGITSGSGSAHSHSFSDSFTTSSVSAGTPSGTISEVAAHAHSVSITSGTPSATVGVYLPVYKMCGTGHSLCQHDYFALDKWVGSEMHTHSVSGLTGSAGGHNHTFTGNALPTHYHSGSVSGTTGSESSHTHGVNAPVLAIDFDWLAVKA